MGVKRITQLLLALFFLALVFFWNEYVAPQVIKLPNDFSFSAEIISIDNFYDEERNSYSGEIYSKTTYAYETVDSTGKESTIKNIFSVKTPNDTPIFEVERNYGVNQETGEHIYDYGDKYREGYLFAPKGLKKGETFTYWHINYDGPALMEFVVEQELYGLRTYLYETNYSNVEIDQTENLRHLPGVGETRGVILEPYLQIWVEPTTGRLVKYQDNTIAYYYDLLTGRKQNPWNKFSNTFHENSVEEIAQSIQWEKTKHYVVKVYIPAFLLFISVIFFVYGTNLSVVISNFFTPNRLRILIGSVVSLTGLISFLGWMFGIDVLIRIIPTANAINPTTAVCFILLGVLIFFSNIKDEKISIIIGTVIATIGGLRLIEAFGFIYTQPDLLLLGDVVMSHDLPARMAEYTALSFLLLGIVPIVSYIAPIKRFKIAEILATIVFIFSIIAIISFMFESFAVISIPEFFFAAVHTALIFLISSVYMYMHFRGKDSGQLSTKIWLALSAILFLSILLTVSFASILSISLTNEARSKFINETDIASRNIEERVSIYINALEGARGLHSASEGVTRDEWRTYVESLNINENYPGIQGVGYAIFVKPDEIEDHISQLHEEGFPEYSIHPEGDRDIYTTIVYLEPFDIRNQQAFGYDMFSNEIRRSAMEQSRDTGEPRMSGRITLVQEIDEDVQPGFLIYVPYYRNGTMPSTQEERQSNIVGYTYSPFRARNFVEGILGAEGLDDISLVIEDGALGDKGDNVLYSDKNELKSDSPRFTNTRIVYLAGRPWTLTFNSSESYGVTTFTQLVFPFVLIAGIVVSSLVSMVFYTLASSRQKAKSYADKVTKNLKESKAKDEAILASIGEGLIVIDNTGVILLVNDAFEKLLGWGKDEVYGKKITDIISTIDEHGNSVQQTTMFLENAVNNKTTTSVSTKHILQYRKKDGSFFPVAITMSPVIFEGQVIGAVEVFRDITQEREIDKVKTEFVSLASHQLRTPLTSINWYTELLSSEIANSLSEDQKKYLNEITTGSKRMVDLVNALLNASRIEMGTFAVDPTPTDVLKLLQSVLDELRYLTDQKKIKIIVSNDNVPEINVDPKLFRIVYQNLLTNAVKYTPEEGLVRVTHQISNNNLLITISDTGYGIPKAQHEKIFQKLFRADNVRERDTQGTGLGLYIVKSIVEHSGGKIWFESQENMGTKFYVQIPLSGMKKKEGSKPLEA